MKPAARYGCYTPLWHSSALTVSSWLEVFTLLKSITSFSILTFTRQDVLVTWNAHFVNHCKIPAIAMRCGAYCPLPVPPSCEILFCNYMNHCQVFVLPKSAASKQSYDVLHIARSLRCAVGFSLNTYIYKHTH